MRRRIGSVCTHAVVTTAVFMIAAAVVMAHMALQKSAPEKDAVLSASPDEIQLWFTQEPDPAVSNVSLAGDQGEIELGDAKVMEEKSVAVSVPALDPGTYSVNWRSAGDDGHIQRGQFSFTIRAAE
jgi:methionine-rich copper-binding protein CopC